MNEIMTSVGKPMEGHDNIVLFAPNWESIEEACSRLNKENRVIAQAKAMKLVEDLESSIERGNSLLPWGSPIWKDRHELSKKQYIVEERLELIPKSSVYGLGALVLGFMSTSVAIVATVWSWYFMLDRIREVSQAMRGK